MGITTSINAISDASRSIPQGLGQQTQHSPEWRVLLQSIRNASICTALPKEVLLARVYQASLPIFVVSGDEPFAIAKNVLLDTIQDEAKRHGFEAGAAVGDGLPAILGSKGEVLAEAEKELANA